MGSGVEPEDIISRSPLYTLMEIASENGYSPPLGV